MECLSRSLNGQSSSLDRLFHFMGSLSGYHVYLSTFLGSLSGYQVYLSALLGCLSDNYDCLCGYIDSACLFKFSVRLFQTVGAIH